MSRIKPIRQQDKSDCGAACLASIAGYHGLNMPLARIRDYASTGTEGTNILGLTEAAEKMGMAAKGVKGPFDALQHAPLPSIAHVITSDRTQHFVVISSMGKKYVRCMDPAMGKLCLSQNIFSSALRYPQNQEHALGMPRCRPEIGLNLQDRNKNHI